MVGSAVGLGNIWRFPYMVGEYGGAAFIIVYLLCAFLLSVPIFISEAIIGRSTQANTFGAMKQLAPDSKWKWVALFTVLTPMIILSYYSVVGGWSVGYFFQSVAGGFSETRSYFGQFSSSVAAPLVCHTIFLLATCLVVLAGVKKGIENFNKISLPVLFVLIVTIAVYSICLPGAGDGVRYLVKPDFSQIGPKSIAFAMGQAFFSLSLGVGTVLVYSSYMNKGENIAKVASNTVIYDLLFAILAGFAVMPAVFAAGIKPSSGPGLIFESIPYIFASMGGDAPVLSRIISILFFVTIIFAALTSSISICEVGVAYLVEEKRMKRAKAVALVFAFTWTLGALCSLSFGPLSGVKIAGLTIFSFCDSLTSNFLMTLGSLLFVVFVGWKMSKAVVMKEFTNNGSLKFNGRLFEAVYFLMRYVAPIAIVIIFIANFIS